MGSLQLFTALDGRISRRTWWLGVFGLFVATLVIGLILSGQGLGFFPTISHAETFEAMAAERGAGTRSATWGALIAFVIVGYPYYAISIKRRHDRNSNGLDLQLCYGAALVLLLLQAVGIGYGDQEMGVEGITFYGPGTVISTIGAVVGIFGIYMLAVLGFLKGTDGANDYGPDPLASGVAATAQPE